MWLAQKPYARAVALLDGDGDARTRVQWAASEIAGFVEKAFPPELWARQQHLVAWVTSVRSSEGSIRATQEPGVPRGGLTCAGFLCAGSVSG
jgi:hypothetical protein